MTTTNLTVPVTTTVSATGYTINVGVAGEFTNAGQTDISASVNAALAAAPADEHITLDFDPGVYGEISTILLPSNTSVFGNAATLGNIYNGDSPRGGGALMANLDAYDINNTLYANNANGTVTIKPYNGENTSTYLGSDPIVDSNISIQGMTFNETQATANGNTYSNISTGMFGTWFTNCQNIDVQDNTYIGGTDGNAFVNVVDGVVSNNVAIGMINAAYDNWDGPSNITIEDNSALMSADPALSCGWDVLINSTQTGDPNNPGVSSNDGVIDNNFSSQIANIQAVLAAPLDTNDISETNITQQGNIDSGLGSVAASGFDLSSGTFSSLIDNIVSGDASMLGAPTSVFQANNAALILGSSAMYNDIEGNLAVQQTSQKSTSFVDSYGINVINDDNAALDFGSSSLSLSGTAQSVATLIDSAATLANNTSPGVFTVDAPPTLFASSGTPISVGDICVVAPSSYVHCSATILCNFGTLSLPASIKGATYETISGENAIVLSGSYAAVDSEINQLTYVSNSEGWDDSIEIEVMAGSKIFTTRYIPVIVNNDTSSISNVTTIAPGLINAAAINQELLPGLSASSAGSLTGEFLVASTGNNSLIMGSLASAAFLGQGNNSLEGGTLPEYISTGSGMATLDLDQGGDVTVAGGAGQLNVAAITGNDLIQVGASSATVSSGANAVSVLGGLGQLTFDGGSGSAFLATLPQDGGDVAATLGAGQNTVYALSGNDRISSSEGALDTIYLGSGTDTVFSAGDDTIYGGTGSAIVGLLPGAMDQVISGSGMISFESLSQNSLPKTLEYQASNANPIQSTSISILGADPLSINAISNFVTTDSTSQGNIVSVVGSASIGTTGGNNTILGGSGSLAVVADTVAGSYYIDGLASQTDVSLGGGIATVLGGSQGATIRGANAAQLVVALGAGGGVVNGAPNGTTIVTTKINANDTISVGSNTAEESLVSSAGNDTISVSGDASVSGSNGSDDTVSLGGSNVIYTIGNANTLGSAQANVDIMSGQATVSVLSLSHAAVEFNNSNSSSLVFLNQSILSQTVPGGSFGSTTVSGGVGGGLYYGGSAGNNSLIGGSGAVTLAGGGNRDFLESNSALSTNELISGPEDETLIGSASSGSNTFILGNDACDVVSTFGMGTQKFLVTGNDTSTATLTGSAAAGAFNIFDFVSDGQSGGGTYSIANFNPDNSAIYLSNLADNGTGSANIESISSGSGGGSSNTTIILTDHTSITLLGVSSSAISYHSSSNGILIT